jgi:hypothetical protein
VFAGDAISVSRINFTFNATDEIMLLKEKDGSKVLEFYNLNSGSYVSEKALFKDNDDGKIVAVTGLNVVNEYVRSLDGDSDEIVALRQKENTYTAEMYKIKSFGEPVQQEFFVEKASAVLAAELLGEASFTDNAFLDILPVRTNKGYSVGLGQKAGDYNNRPIDGGIIRLSGGGRSINIKGKIDGKSYNETLSLDGDFLCAVTMDTDFDNCDELVIAVKNGSGTKLLVYNLFSKSFNTQSLELDFYPKYLLSNHVGTYTKNW